MRFQWLLVLLLSLVSMGLSLVIIGQYHMIDVLTKREEQLKMEVHEFDNHRVNQDLIKMTLDKVLAQKMKVLGDLEAALAKLGPGLEMKKKEVDICQEEKKTKTDEFNHSETEQKQTQASFKTESNAWEREINNLKEQLNGNSPICDYVKNNSLALKLCGHKPNSPTSVKINQI